jgi:hypothetical protein
MHDVWKLAASGALAGWATTAGAAQLTWVHGDAQRVAWTNATCAESRASVPHSATCNGRGPTGPGGGVVLAQVGDVTFEANPTTGAISAVTAGARPSSRALFDPFQIGRAGRATAPRHRVVSARVDTVGDATIVSFRIATTKAEQPPEVSWAAYDARTFAAVAPPRAVTTDTILPYWNITHAE